MISFIKFIGLLNCFVLYRLVWICEYVTFYEPIKTLPRPICLRIDKFKNKYGLCSTVEQNNILNNWLHIRCEYQTQTMLLSVLKLFLKCWSVIYFNFFFLMNMSYWTNVKQLLTWIKSWEFLRFNRLLCKWVITYIDSIQHFKNNTFS